MRQRHVIAFLWLIAAFYFVTMVGGFLVMDNLRSRQKPAPFVDPVIWREPFTGGAPQYQPDI